MSGCNPQVSCDSQFGNYWCKEGAGESPRALEEGAKRANGMGRNVADQGREPEKVHLGQMWGEEVSMWRRAGCCLRTSAAISPSTRESVQIKDDGGQ